jgi:hypothetical protein
MQIYQNIKKILENHEKRILHLETLIGKRKPTTTAQKRKKLTDHILGVRNMGFFSRPKTAPVVHKELQGIYHCELNRVEVALLRLQKRREFRKATKTINGKIYQAYVW